MSPSQDAVPFGDVAQVAHELPQAAWLVASTQIPPQGFFPGGQLPSQTAFSSIHATRHGFFPAGHSTAHFPPRHTAAPPEMLGQGSQRLPQLNGLALSTQTPLQR
jgi:hypothetical protein